MCYHGDSLGFKLTFSKRLVKISFSTPIRSNISEMPCPAYVMHCNSKSSVLHCTADVLYHIQTRVIHAPRM